MKKTLLATTALVLVAAHASAVDVELYGQVNKSVLGFDDGTNTDTVITDNALSSTRFGFKGAQALDNGLTASVLFEGEMASNPSNGFVQNTTAGTSSTPLSTAPTFDERQARVGLSGNFGGVYIGQQSTAIDGALTQDLTGAQDVLSADFARIGGGVQFRNATGLSGFSANNLTSTIGQNRDDSVRYDSPIFYGVQGRASIAQGGDSELAAFYDGAYGDFKIKGAAGVQFVNSSTTAGVATADQQYAASVSVAHTSGLAATIAYSGNSLDNQPAGFDEASGWYGKVGYAWDSYEVAADYGQSENFNMTSAAANAAKVTAFGLGAQYNMGNGVSVAGLYRNLDADDTAGGNTDSIDLYGVNMRVKF